MERTCSFAPILAPSMRFCYAATDFLTFLQFYISILQLPPASQKNLKKYLLFAEIRDVPPMGGNIFGEIRKIVFDPLPISVHEISGVLANFLYSSPRFYFACIETLKSFAPHHFDSFILALSLC